MISEMMQSFSKQFCMMEKTAVPDGEGGSRVRWREGMLFWMAQKHDSTIPAQVAEAESTASTYTFLVDKGIKLSPFDAVKRMEDGETFQITSDATDNFTPATSPLGLAMVTARKWRLP